MVDRDDHVTATGGTPTGDEGFTSVWSTAAMADQPTVRRPTAGPRPGTGHRPPRALVGAAVLIIGLGLGIAPASATATDDDRRATAPVAVPLRVEPMGTGGPVARVRADPGYSGAVGATGLATAVFAAAATAVSSRRRT